MNIQPKVLAWWGIFAIGFATMAQAQDITLSAPEEAAVGSPVSIGFEGAAKPLDFITIVAKGAPEGKYDSYQYARENPVSLVAPSSPGDYEVRYLDAGSPYPTRASRPIRITDVQATLEAPDAVDAGSPFEVRWTGPDNQGDFISIVAAGTAEGKYETGYVYTQHGSPVTMVAPDGAGNYEIRYLMGASPYRTLGRRPLTIRGTTASITAPASVAAGFRFSFTWQGPDNERDFITIVRADAAESTYDAYVYTQHGSPAELAAPEDPGSYEVRYLTGQTYAMLAKVPIEVTAVTASVSGPAEVESHSVVSVIWEGPGNELDYVIIVPAGSKEGTTGNYAYTSRGHELRIDTPAEPGAYEYRYVTGSKNRVLASQPVTVTPRAIPGGLQVVGGSGSTSLDGAAVVVVLDASGSMLQKIGGQTRIAIAKASVTQLLQQELPDNVRFSLRVYGHKEADSCRTDVEIPLGPFNRAQAVAKVASVNAMNLAKTPIGASMDKVAADLAGVPGPHLVILLTDGEETCDGDAGAAIKSMVAAGADVRVNIVGFEIDELMLRETFQSWAEVGNGLYINAQNADELNAGLAQAIELPFDVLDGSGVVVGHGTVNGPPVELMPGNYSVRTAGSDASQPAEVKADETTVLTLGTGQ